jgi:hypothetical protein
MPKHTLEQGKNQHNGPPEGDRRLSQQGRNGDTPTRLVRQEDGVLIAQSREMGDPSQPGGSPVTDFSRSLRLPDISSTNSASRDNTSVSGQEGVGVYLRGGGKESKRHRIKEAFREVALPNEVRIENINQRLADLRPRLNSLTEASNSFYESVSQDLTNFREVANPTDRTISNYQQRINDLYSHTAPSTFEANWGNLLNEQLGDRRLRMNDLLTARENFLSQWEQWTVPLNNRDLAGWTGLERQWNSLRTELAQRQRSESERVLANRVNTLIQRHQSLSGEIDTNALSTQRDIDYWRANNPYVNETAADRLNAELQSLQATQHNQIQELVDNFEADRERHDNIFYTYDDIAVNRDQYAHATFFSLHEALLNDLGAAWQDLRSRIQTELGPTYEPAPPYNELDNIYDADY